MPMKLENVDALIGDLNKLAKAMDTNEEGAPTAARILRKAAKPIHAQMKANASHNPQKRSGALYKALKTGRVKRRRNGGQHITIGVHRKDWSEEDYYPAYVEYGHGGPGPAPSHPYIRPAYDTREDEAYHIIRSELLNELRK